mgnify:CR=1 FL=1
MTASFQFASPGNLNILLDSIEHTPVEPVITAATKAYRSWAKTPVTKKLELLQGIEADLKNASEELALGIAKEIGKPLTEARGEMAAVVGKFALTYKDAEEYLYPRKIVGGPFEAEIRNIPRGPAVVIGPFNFPLHLANGAIVPHLLSGNPVIFKPSPVGAVVGAKYSEIFMKHLPEGVFGLVQGQADEGTALCTDPRIRNICFTGSVGVGRSIAKSVAGDFSKSVALEMGGKNALILLDDGDVNEAAKAAVDGICATAGQRCNDTSRAIIHKSQVEAFCNKIKEEFKRYTPGDPCKPETTLGVLVNEAAHKRYAENISGESEWIVKGSAMNQYEGLPGYYVTPSARIWRTAEEGLRCPIIDKEIFAPLLDIFVANTDEEILKLHNAAPFGLAASIYTSSRERFEEIGADLEVGNLYANIPTIFSPSILPFGGCGLSGNGKPAGRGFIRFTADEQAVQFGKGI